MRVLTSLVGAGLLLAGCGGDDEVSVEAAPPAEGEIAVRLEAVEGAFTEGFEVGLRFETAGGEVIGSTLWSDFVKSLDSTEMDAWYDSVFTQVVPAGSVIVRAEVNVGMGPRPSIPDLEGDLPCTLPVEVGAGEQVEVEVSFSGRDDCLRLVGPAGTTTGPPSTPPSTADCSAHGLPGEPDPQPGLPPEVAEMRRKIYAAATACDYETLETLGRAGAPDFTFSFGEDADAAGFWRKEERRGGEPLRLLAQLLNTPSATVDADPVARIVWPSAFSFGDWAAVPAEDRAALRPLYSEEDFEGFERFGSYVGYRVGISAGGDWLFFVAGD